MGVLYDLQKLLDEYNTKIESIDKELVKRQLNLKRISAKLNAVKANGPQ